MAPLPKYPPILPLLKYWVGSGRTQSRFFPWVTRAQIFGYLSGPPRYTTAKKLESLIPMTCPLPTSLNPMGDVGVLIAGHNDHPWLCF